MMRRDKAVKYFKLAEQQAILFSKDSTKVGAILLAPGSHQVLSLGYNGMPRNVDESIERRWERPTKYKYVEHAERNALYNACRHGTPLQGCVAVVTMFPCCDCARALIQAGVSTLVTVKPDFGREVWGSDSAISMEMFQEVGISLLLLDQSDLDSAPTQPAETQ
jgi:dCMP deaminase